MKTRVITGIVMAVIFAPFLLFSGTAAFTVFAIIATMISVFEMCGCIRQRNILAVFVPTEIYAFLSLLFVRNVSNFVTVFVAITAIYVFVILGYAMFSKGKYTLQQAAMLIFTNIYVVFGYCSIVLVRDMKIGAVIFWLIFIAAWLSDTGAYFVGVKFGKHKLCPDLSPKKTVEGLIGGVASCVIISMIYGLGVLIFTDYSVNFLSLLLASIILSLISVFGDLLASYIKRAFKVKDYGALFPGHGGFLDRFDSVLAVAIALFVFCNLLSSMPIFHLA